MHKPAVPSHPMGLLQVTPLVYVTKQLSFRISLIGTEVDPSGIAMILWVKLSETTKASMVGVWGGGKPLAKTIFAFTIDWNCIFNRPCRPHSIYISIVVMKLL